MRSLQLLEVAQILHEEQPVPDCQVTGFCVDSRNIKTGQLFFALKGAHLDGHDFIEEVKEQGACGAVVHYTYSQQHDNFTLIFVDDPLKALQQLATTLLAKSKTRVVAVTGSVGKTTTKEFIGALLASSFSVKVSPGNSNSQIGLPLSILNHTSGEEEILILEMGMSEVGQIAKLIQIAPPEVAIVTTVGLVHAFNFNSIEEIAQAKAEIFQHQKTKLGILDRDIPDYESISKATHCLKHSFSLKNRTADYTVDHSNSMLLFSQLENQSVSLSSFSLAGKHNRHNLLAAIAVARYFQVSWSEVQERISLLFLPEGRFQKIVQNKVIFINDSYNASEMSVKAALESLPEPQQGGKKIAVLGSLLELGKFTDECHRRVGEHALGFVDLCYCFGKECQPIFEAWSKAGRPGYIYEDFDLLVADLKKSVNPNDVVLLKGSRSKKICRIIKALEN